ncbi:MAG: hypothetical protein RSB78_02380, partial [Oscillospiraceae bacterium]
MCNYNEKHDEFCLNTNIRLVGLISNFKLYINGNLLISNCINFSYIKNTLFITKSNNIIYIFSIDANNIVTKLDD